jgi:hypothetical protein
MFFEVAIGNEDNLLYIGLGITSIQWEAPITLVESEDLIYRSNNF